MAARCGQMLLSFVLVLVFVLMLVPVLVLVLVPCSFCFSSPSCSSCPSWPSFVVLVRGPRCQRCAGSSYFFACVLVLLLEEQRRENPHATAEAFPSFSMDTVARGTVYRSVAALTAGLVGVFCHSAQRRAGRR